MYCLAPYTVPLGPNVLGTDPHRGLHLQVSYPVFYFGKVITQCPGHRATQGKICQQQIHVTDPELKKVFTHWSDHRATRSTIYPLQLHVSTLVVWIEKVIPQSSGHRATQYTHLFPILLIGLELASILDFSTLFEINELEVSSKYCYSSWILGRKVMTNPSYNPTSTCRG